jgi:hypothetical protein
VSRDYRERKGKYIIRSFRMSSLYKCNLELHNKKLYALSSSPNIARMIKSRRMRWADHVALWGGGEMHTEFYWRNLRVGDHLEGAFVDGRIILKWILKKQDGGMNWIDLAQDQDRWRSLVNAVMNFRVP